MLLGAAVACKPTNVAKNGVKSVVNVASREIAGAVIGKAEVALTKTITNGVKQSARTAAQKTALVAEKNLVKKGLSWGAENVNAGLKLNTRLASQEIAGGHAFGKHASEFGFKTSEQMAVHIEKGFE